MRKSLASLNWTVAVLFTGIGLFGQSAAAQAPVYRASDFVKPVTTGQSVAYQGEVAAYPVAQTRVLDQASASSGYGSPTSGTLQGRGAVGSGAASRGSGGCACGDSQWTAAANALFLFRNDPASSVLAFNTNDPNERLDASDFNFGMHAGYELALQRRVGSNGSVELRYFGLDHWRSTFDGQTTPNELLQFNAAVPVYAISGTGVSADYGSKLHNAEFNVGRYYGEYIRLLTGFRYLELDERGSASLQNAQVPFSYVDTTRNRLYGGQLGAQGWLICHDRFSVDVVGKAGIYGNAAAQDSSVTTGVATLNASGRGNPTAFVGEIGTNGAWCLTDHLSLRGGYRLLWIDGVALASDQLASTDFFTGTGFNGSGNAFYHGATAGFEFAY